MGLFGKKKSESQASDNIIQGNNYNNNHQSNNYNIKNQNSNYHSNNHQNSQPPQHQPQQAGRWAQAAQAAENNRQGYYNGGGYYSGQSINQEPDEDEEKSEWLSNRTRQVQQESVESSRRALNKLRQAEETSAKNLNLIASQSEQLSNAERRMGSAEHHIQSSNIKTNEIKALSRFFMLPTFGAEKAGKKKQDKLNREREEQIRLEEERYAKSAQNIQQMRQHGNRGFRGSDYQHEGDRQTQKNYGYYTTPDGLERDELENEIDENLNEISSGLSRMKMMSLAMQNGLRDQDEQIGRISDRSNRANEGIVRVQGKVEKIIRKN
ncbi:hypothetical protein HDU92_001396 [Lobulomyces angularis]|nr:hypothetical protein HDU92_001396 [Lobulomyces angularis]